MYHKIRFHLISISIPNVSLIFVVIPLPALIFLVAVKRWRMQPVCCSCSLSELLVLSVNNLPSAVFNNIVFNKKQYSVTLWRIIPLVSSKYYINVLFLICNSITKHKLRWAYQCQNVRLWKFIILSLRSQNRAKRHSSGTHSSGSRLPEEWRFCQSNDNIRFSLLTKVNVSYIWLNT